MRLTKIFFLLFILSSCYVPKKVKEASDVLNNSQQLFVLENSKFYDVIQEAILDCIDDQINSIKANKENAINVTVSAIDEDNAIIKNDANLSADEKALKFIENERLLADEKLKFSLEAEKEIEIQESRKERVIRSIIILKRMQNEIANGTMKLNEYIKVERASELLLQEVKSTFPQIKNELSDLESTLEGF